MAAPKRPNILWVSFEDTNPFYGCYGDPAARTPNVDRLAAEGCRWPNTFSTTGVCAPSRSAIITGMYPISIGTMHMRTAHTHPCAPGERLYGMCHVVFMKHPAGQSREDWLAVWKDSHTQIAIDTQSTFGYRQNVVVRVLGDNAIPCDAIVEEHFPPEAMTSDHAFYDAGDDDELLQRRMTEMMESVARFIDFEHIDVIPMSEYLIKGFDS